MRAWLVAALHRCAATGGELERSDRVGGGGAPAAVLTAGTPVALCIQVRGALHTAAAAPAALTP